MSWQYNFPEHKDARERSLLGQVAKVGEEADELELALVDGEGDDRVLEECLDTVHACETLLRRWPSERVKAARDFVVMKNRARGYYGDE